MYSQPIHLAHELILCIEITQGQVDFNGDSAVNAILCARFLLSVQQEILMNLFSCSTCTGRQRPWSRTSTGRIASTSASRSPRRLPSASRTATGPTRSTKGTPDQAGSLRRRLDWSKTWFLSTFILRLKSTNQRLPCCNLDKSFSNEQRGCSSVGGASFKGPSLVQLYWRDVGSNPGTAA